MSTYLEEFTSMSSYPFSGATLDMDFENAQYTGAATTDLTCTRANANTTDLLWDDPAGYSYTTYSANTLRIKSTGTRRGLLVEAGGSQRLLNSTAPATQTTGSLPAGTYYLWVNGTGSATPTAGTAVGTGFGLAAINGKPSTFVVTTAGTVTVTVSGSLNAFQLESSGITSLLVSSGSTVNRSPDDVVLSGTPFSNIYTNSAASSLFAQYCQNEAGIALTVNQFFSTLSDNSANNRIGMAHVTTGRGGMSYFFSQAATATNPGFTTSSIRGPFVTQKTMIAATTGDARGCCNGILGGSATAPAAMPTINRLWLGNDATGGGSGYGGIVQRVAVFPSRVSDADMQTYTGTSAEGWTRRFQLEGGSARELIASPGIVRLEKFFTRDDSIIYDFVGDTYRHAGVDYSSWDNLIVGTTRAYFSRPSSGFYTNTSGVLSNFATNNLRRGNAGALIEASFTNASLQSQTFDNASWTKAATSVTANSTAAPDGTTTGDTITGNGAAAAHTVSVSNQSFSIGQTVTHSCYVKAGTLSRVQLVANSSVFGTNAYANYNLSTPAVTVAGSAVTASGIVAMTGGWYRCWFAAVATSSTTGSPILIAMISSDSSARVESWTTSGTLILWGAQCEAGILSGPAGPSSYTLTTTAAVTRPADAMSIVLPNGYHDLQFWFDDGSQQTITMASGTYAVPTTLNRRLITNIFGTRIA